MLEVPEETERSASREPVERDRGRRRRRLVLGIRLVLAAQVLGILVTWGYLCGRVRGNDGLWFPRDASIHLANGLFWLDYLGALPESPKAYAKAYQARYPIVDPIKYPPLFYLAEAAAFRALGPAPRVAKGIVLGSCLVGALYQLAWLRRWVGRDAGFLACLFPLLPDVARYSNAILLNVPAVALQLVALYHTRRWLEGAGGRHLYGAAAAASAAALCYQGAWPLVLVAAAWVVLFGRVAELRSPRVLAVAAAAAAAPAAWLVVLAAEGPSDGQLSWLVENRYSNNLVGIWRWYFSRIYRGTGGATVGLAGLGVLAGLASTRWRRELLASGSWVVVAYAFFSYLAGKDPRYMLPLATPLLGLAGVATLAAIRPASPGRRTGLVAAFAVTLAVFHAWELWNDPLPDSVGFVELADRATLVADRELIVVEGNGMPGESILVARIMLGDRAFQRRAVDFRLLLFYAGASTPEGLSRYGPTPEAAVARILEDSGCRAVVVDERRPDRPDPVGDALREVVGGPGYVAESVVPIADPSIGAGHATVYRRLGPPRPLRAFEIPAGLPSPDPSWFRREPVTRPSP